MGKSKSAERVFIALILLSLALMALLMRPFAEAFIFAMVLAATLAPLQNWLSTRLKNRKELSAGLICLIVVLALLLPVGSLIAVIVEEVISGVQVVAKIVQSEGMEGLLHHLPSTPRALAEKAIHALSLDESALDADLKRRATAHSGQVAGWLSGAVASFGAMVFQITMMMITLYFLLLDGAALVKWLEGVSPLKQGQVEELLLEFRKVSGAVLISSVVTSGVQTFAALIGYLAAGVPKPFFFTLVTFIVGFVPAIGAGGACVAASLLILAMGQTWWALFLGIWGLTVVGLSDNFIKPVLVKRGMHMHGGLVFFSLLGGISAFGAVGLVLGPLIITFFLALLRIYMRDFSNHEMRLPGEETNESKDVQPTVLPSAD